MRRGNSILHNLTFHFSFIVVESAQGIIRLYNVIKCADFLTNPCCLGEKASQNWPIEIVLRVTPPLKVHVLSR